MGWLKERALKDTPTPFLPLAVVSNRNCSPQSQSLQISIISAPLPFTHRPIPNPKVPCDDSPPISESLSLPPLSDPFYKSISIKATALFNHCPIRGWAGLLSASAIISITRLFFVVRLLRTICLSYFWPNCFKSYCLVFILLNDYLCRGFLISVPSKLGEESFLIRMSLVVSEDSLSFFIETSWSLFSRAPCKKP